MLCCGPCGVDEYCVAHWPHLQLRGIETRAMIKEMRGPTIHAGFSSPSVLRCLVGLASPFPALFFF